MPGLGIVSIKLKYQPDGAECVVTMTHSCTIKPGKIQVCYFLQEYKHVDAAASSNQSTEY